MITHLDLFSGIGGFSLGFAPLGIHTLAFVEPHPDKKLVLAEWFPGVPNLNDVTKLCPRCNKWFGVCECIGTDQFGDEYGYPDIVTGGVPCQPASALGQMRGALDERWLWPEAIRILRERHPRLAVFENPPSLLVLDDGRAAIRIFGEIAALGYDLWWDVIPAAALGAGHLRERLILFVARLPPRATGRTRPA